MVAGTQYSQAAEQRNESDVPCRFVKLQIIIGAPLEIKKIVLI
jgi:hypothetical protein